MTKTIFKQVLNNGLTVLSVPSHELPKVSIQLWVGVGSADEKTGQRGIAHFLEHLLFKGTTRLSETDFIHIIDKLSGSCNAMTSNDFTMYQIDFPRQHWTVGCDLLADLFCNGVFKKDLFNSELNAVIQELKMYKDDYATMLDEEIIALMFAGHPYHYPVIGYKHELWNMQLEQVEQFYRAHYVPNNATLVVVGDVTEEEVVAVAKKYFGQIPARADYKKRASFIAHDLSAKSITLYRNIEQPCGKIAFAIPGLSSKKGYDLDVLTWIVGRGRGSRLYKKLVDELGCVVDVDAYVYDMFEQSVFFIVFEPAQDVSFETIESYIFEELELLTHKGFSDYELERAINQVRREYLLTLEDTTELAQEVGYSYLATGDYEYFFTAMNVSKDTLKKSVESILSDYCKKIVAYSGHLLALSERDQEYALALQNESDQIDQLKRAEKTRSSGLEGLRYSDQIEVQSSVPFRFPRAQKATLSNGCDLLWYKRSGTELITVVLDFDSYHYVDAWDKQGGYAFMTRMLLEGTKTYDAQQLAYEFEHAGIDIAIKPGYIMITMFSELLEKALQVLADIVMNSVFDEDRIECVREQIIAEIRESADDPSEMVKLYAHEQVYKKHPYAKNELGTVESISSITRDDLLNLYHTFITPCGSAFSIVGDLSQFKVRHPEPVEGRSLPQLFEKIFGAWQGPRVKPLAFPRIDPIHRQIYNYPINRDQVVLGYAGRSVARLDPQYDAIALFDYIFSGGAAGSMGSRLFQLREQSGLFYTIGGSLLLGADEQPGMIFITTIVSRESLEAVEKLIEDEIQKSIEVFSDIDCTRAKNALVNGLVECMASNRDIAFSFLFLRRYKLPDDYFDTRAQKLQAITVADIKQAVQALFSRDKLVVLKIGRV
jgi:zinc protease